MRNHARSKFRSMAELSHPTVFITRNKNRLKIYNENHIFLKHGDEFELEFDNRTNEKWLAKIKLNGEWVSETGLVLRPGEHIFLETPDFDLHGKHHFLFETYNIESDRSHLVQNNGRVEVFFYKKQIKKDNCYLYNYIFNPPNIDWYAYDTKNMDRKYNTDTFYSSNINCSYANMEETGRIEQGSSSNQDFINDYDLFDRFYLYAIEYKILPFSKKSNTIKEIKQYCSRCGKRRKKNENFCSMCGMKF